MARCFDAHCRNKRSDKDIAQAYGLLPSMVSVKRKAMGILKFIRTKVD